MTEQSDAVVSRTQALAATVSLGIIVVVGIEVGRSLHYPEDLAFLMAFVVAYYILLQPVLAAWRSRGWNV